MTKSDSFNEAVQPETLFVQAKNTPLILSIETATRAGSLAVTRGNHLLASCVGDAGASHSTHLLQQIQKSLDEAGISLREIEAFAVATGPGSFTGLRIGLATVKALAMTLNRPSVGVPTLHAVAYGGGESSCTIALLPAGRGEVFAQRFIVSGVEGIKPLEAPAHLKPGSLLDKVVSTRRLKWVGEGAHIHAEAIKARALSEGIAFKTTESLSMVSNEDQWTLLERAESLAYSVAKIAAASAPFDDTYSPQRLHAIYVRPSDAEINEQCLV